MRITSLYDSGDSHMASVEAYVFPCSQQLDLPRGYLIGVPVRQISLALAGHSSFDFDDVLSSHGLARFVSLGLLAALLEARFKQVGIEGRILTLTVASCYNACRVHFWGLKRRIYLTQFLNSPVQRTCGNGW